MSTVIGVACAGGVVIAGDRLVVADGHVRSRSQRHVFDLGTVGAAVVGDPGDVDEFANRLDTDVRAYRTERGPLSIEPLARMASDLAEELNVSGVVTARDDDGEPRLRSIDADGGVTADDLAAFGSGASVALGALEAGHDPEADLDAAERFVRDALSTAAERDAGTGDDIDLYRLSEA
ncbi:MAG: 20S proteasome subunit A/B [Haloplanus sp.]